MSIASQDHTVILGVKSDQQQKRAVGAASFDWLQLSMMLSDSRTSGVGRDSMKVMQDHGYTAPTIVLS